MAVQVQVASSLFRFLRTDVGAARRDDGTGGRRLELKLSEDWLRRVSVRRTLKSISLAMPSLCRAKGPFRSLHFYRQGTGTITRAWLAFAISRLTAQTLGRATMPGELVHSENSSCGHAYSAPLQALQPPRERSNSSGAAIDVHLLRVDHDHRNSLISGPLVIVIGDRKRSIRRPGLDRCLAGTLPTEKAEVRRSRSRGEERPRATFQKGV